MTSITIYRDREGYIGFSTHGHAGYAEYGEDIVCAGISALVLNAINSIEAFTEDHFTAQAEEESGNIEFRIEGRPSAEAELLLESMVLGLKGIQNDYGKKFLTLHFKEV